MQKNQISLILLAFTIIFISISCSEDKKSPTENTNTAPYFSSVPDSTAITDEEYNYEIVTVEQDGDEVTIAAPLLPEWLNFIDNGDSTALLSGIPNPEHVGEHLVQLTVTDGIISEPVEQSFVITVELSESGGDFFLGIMPSDNFDKGTYYIKIQSYDDNQQIELAELTINGSAVDLNQEGYDGFYYYNAEIELNQGQEISYKVTINGYSYSGDLTIPYRPQNVSFPSEYDPSEFYHITWDLAENSQFQLFELYGWDLENDLDERKYQELLPSARSFTIPANWVSVNLDEYDLSLTEMSANLSGNFIAMAMDGAWICYSKYWEKVAPELQMREKVTRIANILNK